MVANPQDVQLPIEHVDVNLHPTKAEVAILHEDAVIQGICTSVQHVLKQHLEYASPPTSLCSNVRYGAIVEDS
jgi:DNA mismatch repair ATPase MutL